MKEWKFLKENVSSTDQLPNEDQLIEFAIFILVFAPIALLMKYDDIEDAITIANGTRYGLGASVFGPDQEECMRVAMHLECGMVSVNDFGVFYVRDFICRWRIC